MTRKRILTKEVTCNMCDGYGVLEDEYGMLGTEDIEYTCPQCQGKGYVIDARDLLTGYAVYTLEEGM